MECDRASVYLLDHKNGRLWSKSAIGSKTILVNINQGLAGWVARNGKTLNILDAHQDERFNPENDKKINYRTKSVLAVPIFNLDGN